MKREINPDISHITVTAQRGKGERKETVWFGGLVELFQGFTASDSNNWHSLTPHRPAFPFASPCVIFKPLDGLTELKRVTLLQTVSEHADLTQQMHTGGSAHFYQQFEQKG